MLQPNGQTNHKFEAVDKLYGQRELGLGADALLKIIDPLIEQRFGVLIGKLKQAEPQLGPLLDIRAQLCEVWRIRESIKDAKIKGESALKVIEAIMTDVRKTDGVIKN